MLYTGQKCCSFPKETSFGPALITSCDHHAKQIGSPPPKYGPLRLHWPWIWAEKPGVWFIRRRRAGESTSGRTEQGNFDSVQDRARYLPWTIKTHCSALSEQKRIGYALRAWHGYMHGENMSAGMMSRPESGFKADVSSLAPPWPARRQAQTWSTRGTGHYYSRVTWGPRRKPSYRRRREDCITKNISTGSPPAVSGSVYLSVKTRHYSGQVFLVARSAIKLAALVPYWFQLARHSF